MLQDGGIVLSVGVVSFRACLQLISDCPPAVQEELDLIDALSLLDDFGVNILPLQGKSHLLYGEL